MKKILCVVWGLGFILFFESCNKEKLEPSNSKNASTSQQQTTQENPAQGPPASECPHTHCPNAPVNTAG